MMAEAEKRKGRGMYIEFESAEKKAAFLKKCSLNGQKGATVIKQLIEGFMQGKFKLDD
jgi:predicted RNA-binding protein YlxR (DUF448 family)